MAGKPKLPVYIGQHAVAASSACGPHLGAVLRVQRVGGEARQLPGEAQVVQGDACREEHGVKVGWRELYVTQKQSGSATTSFLPRVASLTVPCAAKAAHHPPAGARRRRLLRARGMLHAAAPATRLRTFGGVQRFGSWEAMRANQMTCVPLATSQPPGQRHALHPPRLLSSRLMSYRSTRRCSARR